MIKLPDIRQKFSDIKLQVEQRVNHPYLLKYIEVPEIDQDKLLVLLSIMERLELSYNELENYATTTMLVQIALDTHELISNETVDEKNRQLTVLAGDYYSGLYYKLLADSEDNFMIKELSKGIKEVNEHKISVYRNESRGIDELMTSVKRIESSLITRFSNYFKVDLWNELIANLFFMKRLLREENQFINSGSSRLFDRLKDINFPHNKHSVITSEEKRELLFICGQYLDNSKQTIVKGMNQLPFLNDMLEERITSIVNEHEPIAKTLVEEG
ncbi:MAG: heptaprenyl diphosphate synthase [Neobacillus sp.]|nr:heptaprenyl diphosphate synthase [Neobacillus sp.]